MRGYDLQVPVKKPTNQVIIGLIELWIKFSYNFERLAM